MKSTRLGGLWDLAPAYNKVSYKAIQGDYKSGHKPSYKQLLSPLNLQALCRGAMWARPLIPPRRARAIPTP